MSQIPFNFQKTFILPSNIETVLLKDSLFETKGVEVSILRIDKIHPIISGNKVFKLWYFLIDAQNSEHKTILTFGGAYSNHLAATAFACKEMGLKSIGLVRGEKPRSLSHTLLFCLELGMELEFLNRQTYRNGIDKEFLLSIKEKYGEHILIPEGGFSEKGAKGASLISKYFENSDFTHICAAVGTATTLAGVIIGSKNQQEIMGFSVLKNMHDIEMRLQQMGATSSKNYSIIHDYHFGGYAKKKPELLSFMNEFYEQNHIPLDIVYTGKMMFGVYDLIRKNYFPAGSKILCIHTGGLQGNLSLQSNELMY